VGIEAATLETRDGKKIVVVAVRSDLLLDERRSQAALDVLSSIFQGAPVVLAASTSAGPQIVSRKPEIAETVRKKGFGALSWQHYSFAL
jgi:hypothetical protein